MAGHHFISYSSVDAADFALRLCDALIAGPPSIPAWLDRRELRPGEDWDEQIVEAIRACEGLLFIMTRDSVEPHSDCKQEWTLALKYKKPIVPILRHREAELPFRLGSRQYIDFTGDFEPTMARLRRHLGWLASPEGRLQGLKDRLVDANRDLRRTHDEVEEARVLDEIEDLKNRIADQQRVVDDPQGAEQRFQKSIAAGLERERRLERPVGEVAPKFINTPPDIEPFYFQDRFLQTQLISEFLKNESQRLMIVDGRAGIGKTVMVCRVLESLRSGQLPDDGGPLSVDGVVYLSASGSSRLTVPDLYNGLLKLLPDETAEELDALYRTPQATTEAKMGALLAAFPRGRVVVLLDNFEDVIDPEIQNIRDTELDEALRAWLNLPHHAVKAILTTRVAPRDLMLLQPGRQMRLELDSGLESPYAENILREMDVDAKVGLRNAPDELLDEARRRTLGYPRALEALFAILSADRYTTLEEVLSDTEKLLPENVVEVLVGEAFSRLDQMGQHVIEALAIYGRPVPPAAVDYLLGVSSAHVLNRLVAMHFVRREKGHYYLHPVDRVYAFERIPLGEEADREKLDVFYQLRLQDSFAEQPMAQPPDYAGLRVWGQFALLHRGAEYFRLARKPREEWKTWDDLDPLFAEFDLRYAGGEYSTAAKVLKEFSGVLDYFGYYLLAAKYHKSLVGKLQDPELSLFNLSSLGNLYWKLGLIQGAIDCFAEVLSLSRKMEDFSRESGSLIGLGNCHFHLGQTARAIEYIEKSLRISHETNDKVSERICLHNLGDCYASLGQTSQAIEYCEQSIAVAKEIGHPKGEAFTTATLAEALIDEGHYNEAIQRALESVRIGKEINNPTIGSYGGAFLALAYLFAENLPAARSAAETACQYNEPLYRHYALGLLGLIALRQGDRTTAQEAFAETLNEADSLLARTSQNYDALDSVGLALCGLALLEEDPKRLARPGWVREDLSDLATQAYRAARVINADPGVVGRVVRLLDALVLADPAGAEILADARAAVAGE